MRNAIGAPFLWAALTLAIGPAIAHGQAFDPHTAPVTVAVTAAALSSGPCARTQVMTPLQKRIVGKAAQGTDALRDFIWDTRGIYQLDFESTVAWLDRERGDQVTCQAGLTSPVVAQH
jgi:hypothetical protein